MVTESKMGESVNAVIEAEQRLAAAHVALDLAQLEELLHPDYAIIQPNGKIETKQEVLASYASGTRRWDEARSDQLEVRLFGETAVVTGRWTASGQNGAERFDYTAHFLAVWVYADNRWQNVASHSTPPLDKSG